MVRKRSIPITDGFVPTLSNAIDLSATPVEARGTRESAKGMLHGCEDGSAKVSPVSVPTL